MKKIRLIKVASRALSPKDVSPLNVESKMAKREPNQALRTIGHSLLGASDTHTHKVRI